MKKLIKTETLKKATGLSYPTLKKYIRLGWIPQPRLQSFGKGGGRGSTMWWPAGIIFDLALIRTLKKCGYKDDDITKILRGEKI